MFRFRKSGQSPQAWHDKARRCAGGAARGALLGAAAAAKASADAMRWAAEGRPEGLPPEPPPVPRPPQPAARPRSSGKAPMLFAAAVAVGVMGILTARGLPPRVGLLLLGAALVFGAVRAMIGVGRWATTKPPAPPAPPRFDPVPVVIVSPPPPVMAYRPTRPAPRAAKPSSKVLPILAGALVVGVVVALSGVKSGRERPPTAPPPPQNMARLGSTRLTEYAADNAVLGGAKAALKALEGKARAELAEVPEVQQPVPPAAPFLPFPPVHTDQAVRAALQLAPDPAHAKPSTAVRLTGVKSEEPQTSRAAAVRSALVAAQRRLADEFAKLDPPLDVVPSLGLIEEQFLRKESVAEVQPTADERKALEDGGVGANRVWVTADVEVSEEQVRQLRGDRRLTANAPLFLFALVLTLGMYGFLRLDAATKGYLTGVLLLGYGGLMAATLAFAALTAPW